MANISDIMQDARRNIFTTFLRMVQSACKSKEKTASGIFSVIFHIVKKCINWGVVLIE